MMQARSLPTYLWDEAVVTPVYILNLSPIRDVRNQTPYEAWTGRRPTVSHLRVFGCIAYALVKTYSHKFDEKSEKYIFVDYSSESKAYKLHNPFSGKITIGRDVVFQETASWDLGGEQVQEGIPEEVPSIDKP